MIGLMFAMLGHYISLQYGMDVVVDSGVRTGRYESPLGDYNQRVITVIRIVDLEE